MIYADFYLRGGRILKAEAEPKSFDGIFRKKKQKFYRPLSHKNHLKSVHRPRPPLLHPSLHKAHLITLRLLDRSRRQLGRRLVGKQAVLVPMVHGARDQDERFVNRARPVLCFSGRVRRRRSPRVLLPVHKGQPGITDVVAAVSVDDGRVGRGGDVEGVAANDGFVLERDCAGDERQLGLGDAGAGLEVAPLAAVLVGPAAPGLSDVVLGVEGGVVVGEAFVCRCP